MLNVSIDGIKSYFSKLYNVDPKNIEVNIDDGIAHVNITKKLDAKVRMVNGTLFIKELS